jgi:three-Cys-motif partner protein
MLEFVGDAISLSGSAGTKLKCDVLGKYYPFWWNITSGGRSKEFVYETAIVELHAGTGEIYVEDTKETILGSAGHALELKSKNELATQNLKIILIEDNQECRSHLKNVIKRRWHNIPVDRIEGPFIGNISKGVYLLKFKLNDALDIVKNVRGNALYFFDPLRGVEWSTIEYIAQRRLSNFYQTGTEFIIFIFTSDWFLGRDNFSPLPTTNNEELWSSKEKNSVAEADALFGGTHWRERILDNYPIEFRQNAFVQLYKKNLRKLFRYILPLPFNPKSNQLYHIIFCSNYEAGVRMNKDFYSHITGNPQYKPDNSSAFKLFKQHHPDIMVGLKGQSRPLAWKILWKIIIQHEDGVCDCECADFKEYDSNPANIQSCLHWLAGNDYIEISTQENKWGSKIDQYTLNWKTINKRFNFKSPEILKPISPEQIKN